MTDAVCPACGRRSPSAERAALAVYEMMKGGKELYKSRGGDWYLTYGGGRVLTHIVNAVRCMPGINPAYSNTDDALRFGPTVDVTATQNARASGAIGRRDLVYVERPHD